MTEQRNAATDSPRKQALMRRNLFEELIQLRDQQRADSKNALCVIKGSDVPTELSRLGLIQWYLHPAINDTVSKAKIVWVTHIPPHSRTGKLQCQGGQIYYVWKGGSGHTVLDGERHDWGVGCVINIPLGGYGVVFQHFNDSDEEVLLIGAEENMVDSLSVDRGAGFEILESCPEWDERQSARASDGTPS